VEPGVAAALLMAPAMSERTAVYDLGEVHVGRSAAARGHRAAAAARRRPAEGPRAFPKLAATLSLFLPGTGHLAAREPQAALFFAAALGFAVSVGWALLSTLASLVPTLALLGVPSWTVAVTLIALYVLAILAHVGGVVDAHAAAESTSPSYPAPRPLCALASAVVPGWGQALAGRRTCAGLFLTAMWLVGAAWLIALPEVRETFAHLGFPIPVADALVQHWGPGVLLASTTIVWAASVWDAAAGR
jgi:hypothetical protein